MKAIADSGSTKCEWIFGDGDRILRLRTAGINAVQQSPDAIRAVLAELPPLDGVEELRFYGAGCGDSFPEASAVLRRELAARLSPMSRHWAMCSATREAGRFWAAIW